jgi:hypothetical protein
MLIFVVLLVSAAGAGVALDRVYLARTGQLGLPGMTGAPPVSRPSEEQLTEIFEVLRRELGLRDDQVPAVRRIIALQIDDLERLRRSLRPEIESILSQWVDPATGQASDQPGDLWDEPSRSLLREVWRDFSRAKKLPSDFVITLSRECSLAQQVCESGALALARIGQLLQRLPGQLHSLSLQLRGRLRCWLAQPQHLSDRQRRSCGQLRLHRLLQLAQLLQGAR